jgi:hypothetical protein
MFKRQQLEVIVKRLREQRRFIQVLAGPCQVGKTTLAQQAIAELEQPSHYSSADDVSVNISIWIEQQWDVVRIRARHGCFFQSIQTRKEAAYRRSGDSAGGVSVTAGCINDLTDFMVLVSSMHALKNGLTRDSVECIN